MAQRREYKGNMATFKEKTREEIIAAFKKAVNRKREWEIEAQKEFADIRARQINV